MPILCKKWCVEGEGGKSIVVQSYQRLDKDKGKIWQYSRSNYIPAVSNMMLWGLTAIG